MPSAGLCFFELLLLGALFELCLLDGFTFVPVRGLIPQQQRFRCGEEIVEGGRCEYVRCAVRKQGMVDVELEKLV